MNAIETIEIKKEFGELVAVDSVSFNVKQGEIFGLLGPNGAGKTTLISMLVTMKKPSSGKASVNGFDIVSNPDDVRKSIGIVFQDPSLDEDLTAYENMDMHAAMYGIPTIERRKRIEEVIEMVELKDRINDIVKTYSGGMRRRLEIARALIHWPKVLFLDEPTLGLDPQTRKHVWNYVKKLKEEHGITIMLTTHYMDEADSMCDRIAIIDHGKIIIMDTPAELKNSLGGDTVEVDTQEPEKLAVALMKVGLNGAKTDAEKGKLILHLEKGEQKIPIVMKVADEKKINVSSINLHKPTLDDVFMHYTGRQIREEVASGSESFKIRKRAWGRRA